MSETNLQSTQSLQPNEFKSAELKIAEGKIFEPNGVSQQQLFESMVEGNYKQAQEYVARVSPEDLIKSVEKRKRDLHAKTISKALSDRFKMSALSSKRPQDERSLDESPSSNNRAVKLKEVASKFFGLMLNAERDMHRIEDHIERIGITKECWNPAQLFLIQVRVAHMSQQIELFTSMLNKALESSKQLFNTQI